MVACLVDKRAAKVPLIYWAYGRAMHLLQPRSRPNGDSGLNNDRLEEFMTAILAWRSATYVGDAVEDKHRARSHV